MKRAQRDPNNDDAHARVQAAVAAKGLATPDAQFTAMPGGRTNQLWRYDHKGSTFVCKLFAESGTPLFPNSARDEASVLTHLQGTRLAPELVALVDSDVGNILIYRHVTGPSWNKDTAAVAKALSQIHVLQPPQGLRRLRTNTVLAQGAAMLDLQNSDSARLNQLRPPEPDLPQVPPVFLHGDAVPENIIETPQGVCLIDWQCPAAGDPTEDIAIFLSPAMQHVNGRAPLTKAQKDRFFVAYDDPDTTQRYRALAPAYHWRMATYCLWKVQHGDRDYLEGFRLEIAQLEVLS